MTRLVAFSSGFRALRAAGYALTPEDDVTRREIDRVYYESEKKRRKRQDEVFGPSPFRD